jgi:hypothetical protein
MYAGSALCARRYGDADVNNAICRGALDLVPPRSLPAITRLAGAVRMARIATGCA